MIKSEVKKGIVSLLLLGIVAVLLLLGLTVFGPWELPGLGQLSQRQQQQQASAQQVPPPPPPDSDSDGFSDTIETYLGTDPYLSCPKTTAANDEAVDAWPPDFNDNRTIAIDDTNAVTGRFNKKAVGEHRRYDLNGDGWIRVDDIYAVSSRFNQKCTYPTPTGDISAAPNPCIIATGGITCESTIGWKTSNASLAYVCFDVGGGGYVLWAEGLSGDKVATIKPNAQYVFVLRTHTSTSCTEGTVLSRILVTATTSTTSPLPTL